MASTTERRTNWGHRAQLNPPFGLARYSIPVIVSDTAAKFRRGVGTGSFTPSLTKRKKIISRSRSCAARRSPPYTCGCTKSSLSQKCSHSPFATDRP